LQSADDVATEWLKTRVNALDNFNIIKMSFTKRAITAETMYKPDSVAMTQTPRNPTDSCD